MYFHISTYDFETLPHLAFFNLKNDVIRLIVKRLKFLNCLHSNFPANTIFVFHKSLLNQLHFKFFRPLRALTSNSRFF